MLWTAGLCLLAIMHGAEAAIDRNECNEALLSLCERCIVAIEKADCSPELPVFCQIRENGGVHSGCCRTKHSTACKLITTTEAAQPKDPNLLAIIGGVAGSLALLIGLVAFGVCFRRYRRRKAQSFPIELLHHLDLSSRRNIAASSVGEAKPYEPLNADF